MGGAQFNEVPKGAARPEGAALSEGRAPEPSQKQQVLARKQEKVAVWLDSAPNHKFDLVLGVFFFVGRDASVILCPKLSILSTRVSILSPRCFF